MDSSWVKLCYPVDMCDKNDSLFFSQVSPDFMNYQNFYAMEQEKSPYQNSYASNNVNPSIISTQKSSSLLQGDINQSTKNNFTVDSKNKSNTKILSSKPSPKRGRPRLESPIRQQNRAASSKNYNDKKQFEFKNLISEVAALEKSFQSLVEKCNKNGIHLQFNKPILVPLKEQPLHETPTESVKRCRENRKIKINNLEKEKEFYNTEITRLNQLINNANLKSNEILMDLIEEPLVLSNVYYAPTNSWLNDRCRIIEIPFYRNCSENRRLIQNIKNYEPSEIFQVSSDGHCRYRSLSVLLCGNQEHHREIRQDICTFISSISDPKFETIFTNAKTVAREKLKLDPPKSVLDKEYWMSDMDLAAAAHLYQCNICIYSSNKIWQIYGPNIVINGKINDFDSKVPTILMQSLGNQYSPVLNVKKK